MISSHGAPKISIVIPLYNKAAHVADTIKSVQAQGFTNWEIVVVDDGSTDDGCARVAAMKDQRIRIIRQSNQGVSAARNNGIRAAQTALIAFLDADDEWLPDYLETIMYLVAAYPQAAWYATGYRIAPATKAAPYPVRLKRLPAGFTEGILPNYFLVASQSDPPVWTSTTVVKREAVLDVGGFPVGVASGEDLLTWARLAIHYPLAYDTRALAVFHVSGHARPPDSHRRVGQALTELLRAYPTTPGLRAYLGLWYRMQAVMALRFEQRLLALQCMLRSLYFSPLCAKSHYQALKALLPYTWGNSLDSWLRKVRTKKSYT